MIYFVASPIGNLRDITLRALDVLKEVDIICCEDTRNTSVLLNHYGIKKRLLSFHMHNEKKRGEEIIDLALDGKSLAIVSDAGMPGISDPGTRLIGSLIERGIDYTVLPGPSAFTTALVYSAMSSAVFKFMGFLPVKGSERKSYLKEIEKEKSTIILYEAPHKLDKTMDDLIEIIPNRRISIVRELTKIYEEHIDFLIKDYHDQDFVKRGELVLVIGPDEADCSPSDDEIKAMLVDLLGEGLRKSEAVADLSESLGLKKNRVYKLSKEI